MRPIGASSLERLWHRALPLGRLLLGAGAVLGFAALGVWLVEGSGCRPQLELQFTGSGCAKAERAFEASLWHDTHFALIYGLALWVAAIAIPAQQHLDERLGALDRVALAGPVIAAVADALENLLLGTVTVHSRDAITIPGDWDRAFVTALAIVKWVLLLIAVGVLLMRLANWRPARDTADEAKDEEEEDEPLRFKPEPGEPDELALCCSGGGIRSAAFSLGVLRELDEEGVMSRVRMIAAVSGGNYAATGWLLARAAGEPKPAAWVIREVAGAAERDPFHEGEVLKVGPGSRAVRRRDARGRHRFLANGPGGLSRAVFWALGAVTANVMQLLVVIVAVGWPLGKLARAEGFHPELPKAFDKASEFVVHGGHIRLLALLGAAALLLAALPALPKLDRLERPLHGAAKGAFALFALALFILLVGPWLLVQFANVGDQRAFQIGGGVSLATLLGAIARALSDPLRRIAPRLGGVALAVLVLLLLGKVVYDSARQDGLFQSPWVWAGCLVASLLLAYCIDTQTWSLREMYRARLTNSFVARALRPDGVWQRALARLRGRELRIGTTWDEIRARQDLPELIVCCAASRVGLSPEGAPAESFTVSQRQVCHHRAAGSVAMPTSDYVRSRDSRATEVLRGPAGWLATSGAAFASAMGRSSIGSTNALMAALNIDLGVWLPALETPEKGCTTPPIGLGHLANEILGLYSDRDDAIFVADGGHVENLGLVELLRNRRRQIVCVDASGDVPGSFSTLRAALEVADDTLPEEERLQFDLRELDASTMPAHCSVYRIPFHRWGKPWQRVGVIHYLKLQPSLDQGLDLRQFANADPSFPSYSTANQLLDDQQFAFLLVAGAEAGHRLCMALNR